jgi:cytoskeletal protein CcmA (bactofilin family)
MSIWGKKGEGDPRKPAPPPVRSTLPISAEPKKEPTVSTNPNPTFRTSDADNRNAATIGKAVKVVGQIYSREDLFVDGDVEGTIELLEHKLTVGPNGKVNCGIRARDVVVLGAIQGNVEAAERIEIKKDARLVGDIKTARIVIEDGAYFKGSIDIVKPEAKPQPPQPKPQAAPASASVNSPASPAEVKR